MHDGFKTHKLNPEGLRTAAAIGEEFNSLLAVLVGMGVDGRYLALVTTKLEEACFFAKKGIAVQPHLQEK